MSDSVVLRSLKSELIKKQGQVSDLETQINGLRARIEVVNGQVQLLRGLIQEHEPDKTAPRSEVAPTDNDSVRARLRAARNHADALVALGYVFGKSGGTTMEYIETGAEFGVSLKRDSIASRLSKLVRDGVFANEDGRYVLIDATKLKATKARRKPYNGADDPRDGTLQDLTYFVVEKYGPMKRAQICKKNQLIKAFRTRSRAMRVTGG